jgi:hypothetical protein
MRVGRRQRVRLAHADGEQQDHAEAEGETPHADQIGSGASALALAHPFEGRPFGRRPS